MKTLIFLSEKIHGASINLFCFIKNTPVKLLIRIIIKNNLLHKKIFREKAT